MICLSKSWMSSEMMITPRSSLGLFVAFGLLTMDIFHSLFSIVTTFACTRVMACRKLRVIICKGFALQTFTLGSSKKRMDKISPLLCFLVIFSMAS